MTIEVDIGHQLPGLQLEVRFAAGPGITVLFGASGAGKTSVIDILAGLRRPERGRITVNNEILLDTALGIDLPVHRRRVGYVFQDGRLFPHLTVAENLDYARRFNRLHAAWADRDRIIELLGIGGLLARRPAGLSGGEKQRIAIGRALLASPRLLLMDEPLSALDAARKAEILPYIECVRDQLATPVVYVSHAIDEVARLADTIVVLKDGQVAAAGPAVEVMGEVETMASGGLAEPSALLTARVAAGGHHDGLIRLDHAAGELWLPGLDLPAGTGVRLRVRARDVALATGDLGRLSIRNRLKARVRSFNDTPGAAVDVVLVAGDQTLFARVTRDAISELALTPGSEVTALIKTSVVERHELRVLA